MNEKYIPGTNMTMSKAEDAFSVFRPMIEATGGLSLSQICKITGLQPSTIQNWSKRSYIPRPENKKYYERHLSRILLISALRDCMNIEQIGELMVLINGDTEDLSDDIISESKLYDYFVMSICRLDDLTFDDQQIENAISLILKEEESSVKERVLYALKVMVYAYIIGKCLKQVNTNLDILRG